MTSSELKKSPDATTTSIWSSKTFTTICKNSNYKLSSNFSQRTKFRQLRALEEQFANRVAELERKDQKISALEMEKMGLFRDVELSPRRRRTK